MQIVTSPNLFNILPTMYPELINDDIYAVLIESRFSSEHHMQEARGIEEALKLVDTGKPIVMFGWQTPRQYANKRSWHAAMAYSNIAFARLGSSVDEVINVVDTVRFKGHRLVDPLALEIYKRAKVYKISMFKPLNRQKFPDVCVSIDGTFCDEQNNPRPDVLQRMMEVTKNKPTTILISENSDTAKSLARRYLPPWKFVATCTLAGAKVHTIISHLERSKFTEKYEIACNNYIRV